MSRLTKLIKLPKLTNKPQTMNHKPLIIQNKPNFRRARMNLNFYSTKDYENENHPQAPKKQTQSNPISPTPKEVKQKSNAGCQRSDICLLPSVFCLLSSAFCFLSSAFCFLSSVFCLLPSAFCFLSSVHGRLLINPMLLLYKPGNVQYYSRRKGRCSSMVEHSFRKAEVEGPTPSIGFMNLNEKYNSLQQIIKELAKVVVAYCRAYSIFVPEHNRCLKNCCVS